jgi:hypothetical protein
MQHSVTISLLLAGLLTLGHTASSQRPAYGVYFTAGTINCNPARGASRLVLAHSWLHQGDKITLVDNVAEITLFDHDTSYVRLRGKGTYTMDDIGKMQHTRVRDSILIQYLSLSWAEVIQPAPPNRAAVTPKHSPASTPANTSTSGTLTPTNTNTSGTLASTNTNTSGTLAHTSPTPRASTRPSQNPALVIAPRPAYATSMDSLIFRWRNVYWARKYFLRLRNPDGRLCYDTVIIDTQAVVHFPGRMTAGNTYTWTLDIVGESGRLQFADSNHIVLVNDSAILPQLPPITPDSIGGFAVLLQRIEQYENAGCTKEAESLFEQLTTDFPQDPALDKLYFDFRRRNYF